MDAMRRGEEWALPPRDKGQVKALARDYVDSRRLIVSEYVLFGVFVVIFLLFVLGAAKNSLVILIAEASIVVVIAVEAAYHSSKVIRLAKQRLPGQSTRGIAWYVAKRSMRLRSSRMPPARLSRGDQV